MKLDYAKHKTILLQILKDIYTDTSIAPLVGFKGGTAVMMFYGLPRYSVDLDFDLLDESNAQTVFEAIHQIIGTYGNVTESYRQHHTLKDVVSYAPQTQQIKVEVNLRQFGSRYEVKTYLGIPMLVMVQEDMFAHKLMAMIERVGKTSRDIFDVYYFARHSWPINTQIVEARSGLSYQDTLHKAIGQLESFDNKHILDGLGELLSESQKDAMRAKLKNDTIFLLKVLHENQG